YYKIEINPNGQINLLNKKNNMYYQNILDIEDCGDWGDEYDYSGPKENQTDVIYAMKDALIMESVPYIDGPSQKTYKIKMLINLPISLKEDRSTRDENLIENKLTLYISLYKGIDRIDFRIKYHNKSKDHRIRAIFNSEIKSDKVYADGHFYIVSRNIELPHSESWVQKALPTNHQKDFICIQDESTYFAVFNKGLPEYEAIKKKDGTIDLGITLLRSIGWLSRGDFASRGGIAGPDLHTPGAQCLGKHTFELSLSIKHNEAGLLNSEVHVIGKNFNNPLISAFPETIKKVVRVRDKLIFSIIALLLPYKKPKEEMKSYLPESICFLKIENKNILLSALKKSEEGNFLILRLYNLASSLQRTKIILFKDIYIKAAQIVNFLEEKPERNIKANIIHHLDNLIELEINPHVIVSLKIEIQY
ncbi:MAG: hypothetical protein EU532_09465, partial [Promethearchaeota archaeon]